MRSVAICGSTRFVSEIREFAKRLRDLDALVYEPNLYMEYDKVSEADKKFLAMGLTYNHFHNIEIADVVYIYNKDGYAGISTNIEIGFAVASDKPIYVLEEEKDEEIFRKNLFTAVAKTPEELLDYLK